jgi:hypothetical protein
MLSALGLFSLAACADIPPQQDLAPAAMVPVAADNPPGAARPLSIGGRVALEEGDARTRAVHCAAALNLTAQQLTAASADRFTAAVAILGKAEAFFLEAAGEAAAEGTNSRASIAALARRRREEKSSEVREQAQLAIACMRRVSDRLDQEAGDGFPAL